jgi:hypothetical protein
MSQRRCELCGGEATVALAEHDGTTQRQHDYCARCSPGGPDDCLAQSSATGTPGQLEPLGEWEVEARQSASWSEIERFLVEYQQPRAGAKSATEQEMRRIAPRVARMASHVDGEMPAAVRDFLRLYGPPAG